MYELEKIEQLEQENPQLLVLDLKVSAFTVRWRTPAWLAKRLRRTVDVTDTSGRKRRGTWAH